MAKELWTPPGSVPLRVTFDSKGRPEVKLPAEGNVPARVVRLRSLPPVPNRKERRMAARNARKPR